ncbi:unnamed protein product [Owenia fusiformis]|uniref:Uncharacterized protein n=1 Tax=Owenia fusiformis TaxID=6347 RepID=A0A8J1XXI3_OWEFU|nr:unnamed protein product [Owenia fusiformis]
MKIHAKPICVLLMSIFIPQVHLQFNDGEGDQCFCKLQGEVDDCSCSVESVDSFNNNKIYPRLQSLLRTDYFKYHKANVKRQCPFWVDDSRCASRDCVLKPCSDDEIPEGLKGRPNHSENHDKNHKQNHKYSKEANEQNECEEEHELGNLDTTISDESKEAFAEWKRYDDQEELFCEIDDEDSADAEYVDLSLNPEGYTGYKGKSASRIWKTIYSENCFKQESKDYSQFGKQEQCLEKRVFFRMLSGLHTSVMVAVCSRYAFEGQFGQVTWGPNVELFDKLFAPENTWGQGPQHLRNLYFTYLIELRALAKAAPYLEQENFYTGNEEGDLETKNAVKDLLKVVKSFPEHFDESKMFRGDPKEAAELKTAYKTKFRNITKIMDCVGCDKCKLWGKLQITGMGTALKILFSGDTVGPESIVTAESKNHFQLTRPEITALLHSIGRLSSGIKEIDNFRRLLTEKNKKKNGS